MSYRTQDRHAFTLVELLVVIGVIAVLIAILLPALNKAREAAKDAKCRSNLRQISMAYALYAQENRGWYPVSQVAYPYGNKTYERGYYNFEWSRTEDFAKAPRDPSRITNPLQQGTYNRCVPTMLAPRYVTPDVFYCPNNTPTNWKDAVTKWRGLAEFLDDGSKTSSEWEALTGFRARYLGNHSIGYVMPGRGGSISGGIPRQIGALRVTDPSYLPVAADMGRGAFDVGYAGDDYVGNFWMRARHGGQYNVGRSDGSVVSIRMVGRTDFTHVYIYADGSNKKHAVYEGSKGQLKADIKVP